MTLQGVAQISQRFAFPLHKSMHWESRPEDQWRLLSSSQFFEIHLWSPRERFPHDDYDDYKTRAMTREWCPTGHKEVWMEARSGAEGWIGKHGWRLQGTLECDYPRPRGFSRQCIGKLGLLCQRMHSCSFVCINVHIASLLSGMLELPVSHTVWLCLDSSSQILTHKCYNGHDLSDCSNTLMSF